MLDVGDILQDGCKLRDLIGMRFTQKWECHVQFVYIRNFRRWPQLQ